VTTGFAPVSATRKPDSCLALTRYGQPSHRRSFQLQVHSPRCRLSRPSPPRRGQAARGRFPSLTQRRRPRGMAAIEDGEEQATKITAGRTRFAVPLACHQPR